MDNLIEKNLAHLQEACRKYSVRELAVFGSVLDSERFDTSSDVDVYVEFDESSISLEQYTDHYFSLLADLEKILMRPIDITTKRSLKNPHFKNELNRTKRSIYKLTQAING